MSRRSRTQRQRAAARRAASSGNGTAPAPAPQRRDKRAPEDPLAVYRSLAAPSMFMRLVLVGGLVLYIAADLVAIYDTKAANAASSLALAAMAAILVFLGGGFIRHQRAIFRIRRENPGAWPTSMRFALSTLPIPLGFGGRAADTRERVVRRLTIVLLFVFAVAALLNSSRH